MARTAILVPYPEMCNMLQPMTVQVPNLSVICIEYTRTEQIQDRAQELEEQGCELIIARGLQAMLARQRVRIPVVEIRVTGQEIGKLILELKEELNMDCPRIGLIGFANMLCDTSRFNMLFRIEMPRYMAENTEELSEFVDKARSEGCHAVIGGDVVCDRAREIGLPRRFIPSGHESLRDALRMASQIGYAIDLEKSDQAEMDTMLNYTFSGIIRVDLEGKILRANRVAFHLLNLSPKEIQDKPITQVLPQVPAELFEQALREGKESYALHVPIQKRALVVNIAPLMIDRVIHGLILTFQEGERIEEMDSELRREMYQRGYVARNSFAQFPQKNPESRSLVAIAKQIAKSSAPILITGEAGAGKEILAQCIHNESLARGNAFVPVDCEAFQEDTLDTMLFGNYTTRKGTPSCMAEIAQKGTLYLAHVDALSPALQYKILSLIKGRLMRNGTRYTLTANIRIIASSERSLIENVNHGTFRHDLYYSMNVLSFELPPLRCRREDIPGWTELFLDEYQQKHGRYISLTQEAKNFLNRCDWPGNLNQLRNVCERMVLLAEKRTVGDGFLRRQMDLLVPEINRETDQIVIYKDRKAVQIAGLLRKYHGNRQQVANALGISKTTLWRYIKKFDLETGLTDAPPENL